MENDILLLFKRMFHDSSKMRYFLVFTLILGFFSDAFCQRHPKAIIISNPDDYVEGTFIRKAPLKSMKAVYKSPSGFKYVEGLECFNSIPRIHWMLTCQDNAFYADDGHFMFFWFVADKLDSGQIALAEAINPKLDYNVDKTHISQIQGYIEAAFGEDAALHWKSYVTYYSQAKARGMFNADTLIALPVKLDSSEYYKGKYKYVMALFIQKNGRGFATFNCFYD